MIPVWGSAEAYPPEDADLAVVIVRLLDGLLTPVLRIAIREQMTDDPRIEVDKRIETLSQVVSRTTATVVAIAVG